jgi:helicase
MLEIRDLDRWLPNEVIEFYKEKGICELYPPQAEAVERGLLDGKNMVVAIPTAAGKTMLAELAMIQAALAGKRSLYIVPLRALASEKYGSFRDFERFGIKVGISTGDFDRKEERLGKNQIIIATSEKADSLIRNDVGWIRDMAVLVADEIHLLNSANRGPTLEITITKLRRLNPKMQILGLSATIANCHELADWLEAEMVMSDWRPVPLREGVIYDGTFFYPGGTAEIGGGKDELFSLVRNTLDLSAQILIFESSRRNAESTASKIAQGMKKDGKLDELHAKVLATGESETARKLAACVQKGVAFHHAGLLMEQRHLVEEGFRKNQIKIISSTPTLAAGLNLPARRVLIKSYRRYEAGRGMVPIPVMEYSQMAGRAGRPALDPYGESFLIAKNQGELDQLMDHYINGEPEEIYSKLASEKALRSHLLSAIATGFVGDEDDLKDFIESTFYAYQQDTWHLADTLEKVLNFLVEGEMITPDIQPTKLGSLVSRLYIDPLSASNIIENLMQGDRFSDLALLHLVTLTTDMELLYIRSSDQWVEEFIDDNLHELFPEDNYDWLLREAKTASMLADWINEVREEDLSLKYHIGPGDIRRIAETAEWLMHATSQLSRHLDLGVTYRAVQLEKRIHYGAGPDLLSLLDIKGIGRVRARKLHKAGYTSMDMLKEADARVIGRIIGPKVAEKVISQVRRKEVG